MNRYLSIHLLLVISILLTSRVLFPGDLRAQNLPEQYRENFSNSFPIRRDQHLEIKAYADKLLEENIKASMESFNPDYFSVEDYKNSLYPYRKKVGEFFGYPPPKAKDGKITKFIKIGEDVHCTIYRVWVEVIEGVSAYGLYMVPKNLKGKAPLIIAQHGGGGNPEAICDLDTRINYHSFGPEAVKRGYIVWAPTLAMNCGYCQDPDIPGASREILDRLEEAKKESARASQFYEKLRISDRYEFNIHPAEHEFDIPAIFRFFDKYLK